MFPLENQATVNLVSQNHEVAIADRTRDFLNVILREDAAGGILRRIQNDQLGAVIDQRAQFVDVEAEIQFLAQLDRHSFRANVIDHRLVDGKSRIRVDDFISFFPQREDAEENDWLPAGNYNHFFGRY